MPSSYDVGPGSSASGAKMDHSSPRIAGRTSGSVTASFAGLMALTTFLALGPSLAAGAREARTPMLHARVVRVSPGMAPYNPQVASSGLPVEEVAFAVRPEPSGNYFSCAITVRRQGKLVGRTQASFSGPWDYPASADLFAVHVELGKRTFQATPSDASVKCRI